MNMGRYIMVTAHMGSATIVFHHKISGERGYARVDPAYRAAFDESCRESAERGWCPLLRTDNSSGCFSCVIYQDRPAFCRNFSCCLMKVRNPDGEEIGRVTGKRSLSTKDEKLRQIWDNIMAGPDANGDEHRWRNAIKQALEREGYSLEVYD